MKWDRRFLELAKVVAGWSKDPSTKVGAVIADRHNRVVSLGFNGLPRGIPDDDIILKNRDLKLRMVVHAEVNAILFAGDRPLEGTTMYVTHHPCARCAAVIAQTGIGRVVTVAEEGFEERWKEEIDIARELLARRGIIVERLSF